jgi:alpha(1,3/1,4) fucosyltransferase
MNNCVDGWVDQRMTDAMRAGCVPIFWGNPSIARDFNPKSFINAHDFKSDEALIDYILEVDRNESLYQSYFQAPYFYDNTPNEYFDPLRTRDFILRCIDDPTPPVASRSISRFFGRWTLAKTSKPSPSKV